MSIPNASVESLLVKVTYRLGSLSPRKFVRRPSSDATLAFQRRSHFSALRWLNCFKSWQTLHLTVEFLKKVMFYLITVTVLTTPSITHYKLSGQYSLLYSIMWQWFLTIDNKVRTQGGRGGVSKNLTNDIVMYVNKLIITNVLKGLNVRLLVEMEDSQKSWAL